MGLFDQLRKENREGKAADKKRKSLADDKSGHSSKSRDQKCGHSPKSRDKKSGHSSKKHGSSSGHSPKKHDGKSSHSSKSNDNKSGHAPKHQRDDKFKSSSKKHEERPVHSSKNNDHKSENSLKNHAHKSSNSYKNQEAKLTKFNDKHKSHNSSNRRESMPSPVSICVISKSKSKKSRSLSPAKYAANAVLKSLKVKVERKTLDDFLKSPPKARPNNMKTTNDKLKDVREPKQKSPLKATPTKAQKKLFEPVRSKKSKAQILRDFNIKKCAVRIRRDNFKKLMREFKKNRSNNKIQSKPPGAKPLGRPRKRPAPDSNEESPAAKKGKISPLKVKTNFFIKISTPKLEKKVKSLPKTSSTSVAHHNKIKNSKPLGITTPTKFSRTQLIRSFGKRFFTSFVRIEKCTHPLLRTFESNDRARRLQTKRNKSKNLSVSFREQVEVFGGLSDSDNSYDEHFCVASQPVSRNGRRASASALSAIGSSTPVVMPARLKKVENGKVVDDIELDPSLFLDPMNMASSTPYSPGRKKRDHKSYSPLKDEGSPSPRKEQLKLANERIPPSGLRRLNIDEDDDEDDDCEYIVPIELPQCRTSRTSSTNTLDGGPTLFPPTPTELVPINIPYIFPNIHNNDEEIEVNKTVTPNETPLPIVTSRPPSPNVDTSPTPIVDTSPTPIVDTSPTPNVDTSPTPNVDASPTPNVDTSPTPNVDASPANVDTSPTPNVDASPTPNVATSPTLNVDTSPTPIVSVSPTASVVGSPITIAEIPDVPESVASPVTDTVIPICSDAAREEEPQADADNDDAESHDSFQSAKDQQPLQEANVNNVDNRSASLSPTSALNDVFDRVAASVIDSACETQQTHDITELNGTAGILKNVLVDDNVSINDMTMNLFIEDDSQADGDSPEKSFVDSIINETIDKLGKDIDEGSPVDEHYTHAT